MKVFYVKAVVHGSISHVPILAVSHLNNWHHLEKRGTVMFVSRATNAIQPASRVNHTTPGLEIYLTPLLMTPNVM